MSKLKETQMFERNTNRNRIRKKKETEPDKEDEETVKKTECLNEAEHETRIDHIDNIMIYSFYDIDSLKAYVTLNNLLKHNTNHISSANNNLINPSRSKSKRKELHKFPSNIANNKKNDLEAYEMNYLKKLDDNLLDNDELSSLSNEENDSEIDSYNNNNNDSKAIIWQTTATEIEKQKQIKKNLLNKKERNISITSSTVSNRSAFSTYSIRSDSSRCSLSPDHSLPECGKAHCKLGCICDEKSSSNLSVSPTPLKNNNNNNKNQNFINNTKNDDLDNLSNNYPQRDHCGRFECMFECNCSRRLRSSTRSKSQNKQEDEEQQQNEEDDIEEEENQQQETEEKSFKRQNSKKTFPNTRQQEAKNIFSNSTKNRLKLDSKAKSISKNDAVGAASAPSTQLRQSKRVKLLKKKSNLKTSQTNKDQCHPSSKPSFKDFYFYYDQDNKLSSLKSRNKNKKLKQETNSDNNSDELEENNKNNNNNNEIEESKINNNNKNDSDFTLESKIKPKKKSILNDNNNNNNNNNNKSKQFEPYTQNITLKVQPKNTFLNQNNGSLVSIQLRIEVFTSKWNKMPQLNKKILRILAKLLQKLNILNETANATFNFKEIEFECDNEINVIVFASSHLKDCSNTTKDDLTNKPICIKVTNYNASNKALLTKQQIKTLVSDEHSDQSNQIFNLLLKKNEETYTDLYNSKHDSTKNIENIIQKDGLITKSLPRLLCRGRNNINNNNQLIKRKPNQTSLIFKSVDNLFEKFKNSPNKYDKLSYKLFEYRPSYIGDLQKQHQPNDIGYIFADEIDYFKKNSLLNNNNQYPFYDPFTDKSLILPMYKTYESVEFVDSICNTINDMIKVVSLYNNNNNNEKMTTLQKEEPLVVSTDQKKQEIIKIQNTGINESKYVIKIQQPVINKNTDINNNNIQKKIIIPSTSMNFKTLVKLVSNKDNETETKTNTNSLDNLNCKILTSSNTTTTTTTNNNSSKIKISSSLVSTSSNLSNVATYSRSIFKTTTTSTQLPPQQITKILAPITSSSVSPKIITMPFKTTSNSTSTMSKIVSIPNSSSSSSSCLAKTFVPIRPKQEISTKQSTLTSLIMNDNHQDDLTSMQDNTNNNNYAESRKRKRKQDLSSFNTPPAPIKSVFTFSKIDEISPSTNNNNNYNNNDNIHLNILNKQINCIKNETSNNLEEAIMSSSKLSIISNSNKFNKSNSNSLNTAFKISPSIFKQVVKKDHHELSTNGTIKRANSIDSLNEKDLLDVSSTSSSSNLLFSSISSHKHSSSSNESSKSSKILVSKENDSEDEILESDNSDFSDMDCASTSNNKRKRKKSKNSMDDDDASSDESSSNEYEDEFEKKIAKKLLGSINNSNKPIVNNIHSIRERQRRFRLKKLLIKLKIVLYECESNCKYDLENSESKLKLEEYFNQKNFKMKSKQNILQEVNFFYYCYC